MYVVEIKIENVRTLARAKWQVKPEDAAGWHVIIGDNGSGKSSFLRSISLALIGPAEADALRQDWGNWLRQGEQAGSISIYLDYGSLDKFTLGPRIENYLLPAKVRFIRPPTGRVKLLTKKTEFNPERYVWGEGQGWFSASYGPFRRFSGGESDAQRMFLTMPKIARHLTLFSESVALTETLPWLKELKHKRLEKKQTGALLRPLITFINQEGFLPNGIRLKEVTSDEVVFVDRNQSKIQIEQLSDGYRSVLSMTLELIRQLERAYGARRVFSADATKVNAPGVVLIDEIDAHLHPSWQRNVGLWFRKHFPRIQFIVTSHSPLVCQAATAGTVWRLPNPGTDEPGGMVTGTDLERLLHGNILDAYSTGMFGPNITRSHEGRKLLDRLAELNQFELEGKLTKDQREEQLRLRATLPTAASTLGLVERAAGLA